MVTLVNQTIYKCEHCRKTYQRKNAAEAHEIGCKKNPENYRACFGCAFLELRDFAETRFRGYDHAEYEVERKLCFCTAKSILVIPPSMNFIEGIDEPDQVDMPKECELFKLQGMK